MNQNVLPMDLGEIQEKFMERYMLSIIYGRAIADVRDGLKPVHRRIIYTMHTGGYRHDRPYRKSARIVGDVLGLYHPHGDASVYEAMARLAQPFSNNILLVDGHGNFGSISGDSPAAPRYTEARMSRFTHECLLEDIDKNAVDFTPNYDQTTQEPVVLPAKLPLLLVNGSFGIGGGYATDIPPHRLEDVCNMVIELIQNPDMSVKEVARKIMPDFPTGGIICSGKAVQKAYQEGRGSVKVRGRVHFEEGKGRSPGRLVITEVPYGITVDRLKNAIAEKCKPDPKTGEVALPEIADIIDESARGKIRVSLVLRPGADPGVLERKLYRLTPLETVQKIILVAVKGPEYKEYNIKELFQEWIDFRRETIRRVSLEEIRVTKGRVHIIDGLLRALANIDQVVTIIKSSKSTEEARERLSEELSLSQKQAQAILEMQLRRLTQLESQELEEEKKVLNARIKELMERVSDPEILDQVIIDEQKEIIQKYGHNQGERKTSIEEIDTDITDEDVMEDEVNLISLSNQGYIKRMLLDVSAQRRGGKGRSTGKVRAGDFIEKVFYTGNKDHLLVFTNTGRMFDLKVWQIPYSKITSIGSPLSMYIKLKEGEQIQTVVQVSDAEFNSGEGHLLFCTTNGLVKRVSIQDFKNARESGIIAISIRENDALIGVKYIPENRDTQVFLATKNGIGISFDTKEVPVYGRTSYGAKGIELVENDRVVSFDVCDQENDYSILTVTNTGLGKRTALTEFPMQRRGGKGRSAIKLRKGHELIKAILVKDEDVMIVSNHKMIRTSSSEFRKLLRLTYGNRVISLEEDEFVVDVSRIDAE